MDVFIDIMLHIFFSILAGLCAWKFLGGKKKKQLVIALIASLTTGILIDVDHLLDYFIFYGFHHFNIGAFFYSSAIVNGKKIYLIFHAFEYVYLFGIFAFFSKKRIIKIVFTAALLSLLLHLCIDIIMYSIPIQSYFITYRAMNGFDRRAFKH